MADQTDDEQRLALEEFQRQQAEKAVQASQNQPNSIPNESPQPVRAVDYAQPNGQVLLGAVGGPSTASMNRPIQDWGTPLSPIGGSSATDYTNRGLIPNQGENAPFEGSPLSDQEQQFWQANPLGAVKDPVTGNLIGLGDTPARQQQVEEAVPQRPVFVNAGLGGVGQAATIPPYGRITGTIGFAPPGGDSIIPGRSFGNEPQPQRQQIPDFVNVPEVDPNIGARRSQISAAISDIDRRLPSAQTNRISRGQPSERERLMMERAHYVRADEVLANEMHNQNQARTHASDLNMKLRDQYAMTQDATALREDFNKIKSKPGTPQYAQDVLNLRINHPDAMRDPRSVELLDRAARSHEEEAAFLQRAQSQGVVPVVSGFHQGHTTYTVPKTGTTLSDQTVAANQKQNVKTLSNLNLTPEQFAQRTKVERGTYPVEGGKITDASKFAGQNEGPHVRVTIGDHQYALSNADYQRLNTAIPQANAPQPKVPNQQQQQEVIRATPDGRQAVFDAATKKFIRYAQ